MSATEYLGGEATVGRVDDALPHEAHDRKREDDRGEEDAMVESRAPNIPIEQVCQEDAERRRPDEEEDQEHRVVDQRLEEVRLENREDLLVVLEANPFDVVEPDPLPLGEREQDRGDRRD